MSRKRKNFSNGDNGNHTEEKTDKNEVKEKGGNKTLLRRVTITTKSETQNEFLKSIQKNIITIGTGSAGTGKTLLSVVSGLRGLLKGTYKKLLFTRPCVEANGENLGFLPGDLREKIHPYMYPIFDFLLKCLHPKQIEEYMRSGEMVTLPLAYMRGTTFQDAFVILDECQNTTPEQIRMFLTRIGENCKVVMTGDPNQSDIRSTNGLVDACNRFENMDNIQIVKFTDDDICRHPIVFEIEKRYKDLEPPPP